MSRKDAILIANVDYRKNKKLTGVGLSALIENNVSVNTWWKKYKS